MRYSPVLEDILQGKELTDAWWEKNLEEASFSLQAELCHRLGRNSAPRYLRERELFWSPICKKMITLWCEHIGKTAPHLNAFQGPHGHRDRPRYIGEITLLDQAYQAQERALWREYLEKSIQLFRSILGEAEHG